MSFKEAVEDSHPIRDAYRPGLQALSGTDRKRVECSDTQSLAGSVNLDDALKTSLPNEPRWDYGVGLRTTGRSVKVHWIEVHPASSHHIKEVLDKLAWLKRWLKANATRLDALPCEYVWIASGSVSLPPHSPQRRRLATVGLHVKGGKWELK